MAQTLLTSIIINFILLNSWFSYIILLIIIGGLLILFIYITSLIPNKKFKFNPFIFFISLMLIIISIIRLIFDQFNINFINKRLFIIQYSIKLNFNKFLIPSFIRIIIIIIYLLIVLIAVVKISRFKSGPLRKKF